MSFWISGTLRRLDRRPTRKERSGWGLTQQGAFRTQVASPHCLLLEPPAPTQANTTTPTSVRRFFLARIVFEDYYWRRRRHLFLSQWVPLTSTSTTSRQAAAAWAAPTASPPRTPSTSTAKVTHWAAAPTRWRNGREPSAALVPSGTAPMKVEELPK